MKMYELLSLMLFLSLHDVILFPSETQGTFEESVTHTFSTHWKKLFYSYKAIILLQKTHDQIRKGLYVDLGIKLSEFNYTFTRIIPLKIK